MRPWLPALLLLAACGGDTVGNTSPSDWNDAVTAYVAAACTDLQPCTSADPATCESDARDMLASIKLQLSESQQADCVACLDALAMYDHDLSATCDMADADLAPVTAACGANHESCAGFP